MRPIDADALKAAMIETLEQIKANPKMDGQEMHIIAGIAMLGEMIDAAPTIDAVPVVRCKDCRHRDPEDHKCDSGETERQGCPFPVHDDYFCAYGERKGGDE